MVLRFRSFGVPVEVAFGDAESAAAFTPFMPPGHAATEESPVAAFTVSGVSDVGVVDAAVRQAIAEHAPAHVFVHAGVVARGGRALLLPAATQSGKSELVAALLRAGASYCSDEFAVLDGAGRVHPYPRPLSLRDPDRDVAPDALGVPVEGAPLPVGAIAFTRFEAAAAWAPRPLSAAEAVLRLLEHAGQARADPDRVLAALQCAAEGAALREGPRGEAAEAAPALLALLS